MEAYNMKRKKDVNMLNKAIKGIDQYSIDTFYKRIIKAYNHALKRKW